MKKSLLIAAFVLCCTNLWAQTIFVPGPPGIQSAIDDANDGDVIVVGTGIYFENIDFLGKAITVTSENPNNPSVVAATVIDGSNPADPNFASVVTFKSGEDNNSVLTGLTITGGTGSWLAVSWEFKGLRWNRCGGGVVCYNLSAPTITANVFNNNIAGQGGGIYVYGDPVNPNGPSDPAFHIAPVIANNTFTNNSAIRDHGFAAPDSNYPENDHGDGGAIVAFQGCDPVITGNLVQKNHGQWYGGGLHLRQWCNGLIEDNHVVANDSALGAGIHLTYTSSPTIRENLIEENSAGPGGGGGIYAYYLSQPLIERNVITRNDCVNGAGIGVYYSSAGLIRNNLIFKNVNGGGIRVRGSSYPRIVNNTVAHNDAHVYTGGIDCTENATPEIHNNIIVSNGSYGIYVDDKSSPTIRYNNVRDHGLANYGPAISNQTGINGNISVPPGFIDPDANDYHLNYDSSCINASDPNFSAVGWTDFDEEARHMGQFVDIGADEAWPVWNLTADTGHPAIQQAIDDANDDDTIVVTAGRYYETVTFGPKNLVLRSTNPNDWDVVEKTIIDANQTGTAVTVTQDQDDGCLLAGFTITGGNAANGHGGGIYCYGAPRIQRNIITDNYSYYKGGGVYFWSIDAQASLIDNIITHNVADYGAAVMADADSRPTITGNVISQNHAETIGAALACSYNAGPVVISNNKITANTAPIDAGISCFSTSAVICSNLIAGNRATVYAGGIGLSYSRSHVVNNTVVNCRAPVGAGIHCVMDSDPNIANNIIAFCSQGQGIYCYDDPNRPSEPDFITNDVFANAGGNYGGTLTDQTGLNGNVSVDPNFVALGFWADANTPGDANDDVFVSGNYHILPGSPCINAGDNNSVPASALNDIDVEQRIFQDTVDIGADEFVTNPFDRNSDGIVDYLELVVLTDEWLQSGGELQSDFYQDNFIDFADLSVFGAQWGWKAGWHQ
jgi:parallel beta-helix repeat protein